MKLPNVEQAEITDRKLLTYLLNHTHPQNKGKAAFYAIVGYANQNTELLRAALLKLILSSEVTKILDTQFGKRYVVEG